MSTSIETLLARSPEYHVWVASYSVTHDRMMRLAFHHGDILRRTEVDAMRCSYFRGQIEGGPYHLAVEQRPRDSFGGKRSPHEYRLYDLGGELEIICDELVVGRVW